MVAIDGGALSQGDSGTTQKTMTMTLINTHCE